MKYTELKERFLERDKDKALKITFQEYLILDFLRASNKSIPVKIISEVTDFSLVSVKAKLDLLVSKNLIDYDIEATKQLGKEFVFITEKGIKTAKRIDEIIGKLKMPISPAPSISYPQVRQ